MDIPKQIKSIIKKMEKSGFQAFVVGGCVRDILRGVEPGDWDITTNAKPEQIQKIFKKSFFENKFGTVTVLIQKSKIKNQNEKSKFKNNKTEKTEFMEVEVTPFRTEAKYTDKRHPDKVEWAKTIEEDLSRRDFTVNAMAISCNSKLETCNARKKTRNNLSYKLQATSYKIIDPFNGQKDLEAKIIRAVGEPEERFSEDALRMMRAIRFSMTLGEGWTIHEETFKAIEKNSRLLNFISKERVRDELLKIIMSERAGRGIEVLRRAGLLSRIIPELEQGFGIEQNKHHIYQIYQHNVLSLDYAAKHEFSKEARIASLLHDVGKPATKRGEGPNSTFYNHEVVGAKMAERILSRLCFPKKDIEKITKLVRFHLFYYNVDEVGPSSVRRLLRKVGLEDIEELLQVRYSDRIGSSVPKAEPYKLRHLKYMFEKVSQDPIAPTMLKVDGNDVMKALKIKPGPKVGQILNILLNQTLNDPEKNKKDFLKKEIKRLGELSEDKLKQEFFASKEEIDKIETKRDEMTKKKYWVS